MLSEFPNSVFVFDEIHAYNSKLTGMTIATSKYIVLKHGTCIFLSATLPKFLRRIIRREIPDIDFIQPSYRNNIDRRLLEQTRHILGDADGDVLSNTELILKEANKARSTLIVCNHVPTAQQVYRELVERIDDTVLLHSQFARRDRNRIESELSRRLPKILVSTQVVEVSLNLDFQQGFTEPAPIDAVVQRLGRINRYFAAKTPAKVIIFTKQLSKDNRVYAEKLRNKSLEVLSSLPNPLREEDLNDAADRVYGKGYADKNLDEYNEGLKCIDIKSIVAGTNQDWVDDVIKDNEGSIELLPEQFLDKYELKRKEGLIIEAFGFLVPVGIWRLPDLYKKNMIDKSHDPWILRNCRYSPDIGLEII
jgi:CRISPR-associated endonuclease/helicase Cas3